jgi:hypothetical protein
MKPDNQRSHAHGVNSSRVNLKDKKNNANGATVIFLDLQGK